ncbi:MAG: LysR family transcriptional regulator [Pseudomonadota bacterium]
MPARLDVRHLEMVLALKSERTVAEAARALRVTPSALSHRIREAERRLNVMLYQKQGRNLRPTLAAEILADSAERVLGDLEWAEQLAVATTQGVRHIVRLTVGVYNSYHWLPDFLNWFRAEHPSIDIDIEADAVLYPLENLASDKIDLVISPGITVPQGFERLPLFRDELVAFTAPDHPFVAREFIDPADFRSETNLTYSMVREPGFEWDRFWKGSDVHAARELKIGSVEAISELLKAGLGAAILSRWALKQHLDAGTLQATQLGRNGIDITWNAVTRRSAAEDAPERTVAKALKSWFAETVSE